MSKVSRVIQRTIKRFSEIQVNDWINVLYKSGVTLLDLAKLHGLATPQTPASATAQGVTGSIVWDADYVYICTATNQWKRTAIATW